MIRRTLCTRPFSALLVSFLVGTAGCGSDTAGDPEPVFVAPGAEAPQGEAGTAEAETPNEDAKFAADPMGTDVDVPFSVVPDMDKSRLSFVSTKNAGAEVPGTFQVVLGGFDVDAADACITEADEIRDDSDCGDMNYLQFVLDAATEECGEVYPDADD